MIDLKKPSNTKTFKEKIDHVISIINCLAIILFNRRISINLTYEITKSDKFKLLFHNKDCFHLNGLAIKN
jgi:hypothetical protein